MFPACRLWKNGTGTYYPDDHEVRENLESCGYQASVDNIDNKFGSLAFCGTEDTVKASEMVILNVDVNEKLKRGGCQRLTFQAKNGKGEIHNGASETLHR